MHKGEPAMLRLEHSAGSDTLEPSEAPRLLGFVAWATLLYPVVLVIGLYGELLLAWYALGHQPRPRLDDPMHIAGSNQLLHVIINVLNVINILAIMGTIPVAWASLILNGMHVMTNRTPFGLRLVELFPVWLALFGRLVLWFALWLALLCLWNWDLSRVKYWWFD
jgi:hypothetical protein